MKNAIVGILVAILVFGTLVVLSRDGAPPPDQQLMLHEGAVPAHTNGYVILVELLDEMHWPSDDAWIGATPRSELSHTEAILELVENNRAVLDRLASVVAAEHFRAPAGDDAPLGARQLGRLVGLDAALRMRAGDEAGAFATVLQYLEMGHRLQATGELMTYLIGAACESVALEHLIYLAADSDGNGVEAYVPRLRALGFDQEMMENALRREYAFLIATIDESFQEKGWWMRAPGFGGYLYQPHRTQQLFADSFTEALARLSEPCATVANERTSHTFARWRYLAPNAMGNILYNVAQPNLESLTFSRCREQMSFGLTELVLALHAYRAQEGQLPKSLGVLVPRYVDTLPIDVDGGELRWVPAEGYVYSVGEDRIDQGGGEPSFRIDWTDPDPGISLRPR